LERIERPPSPSALPRRQCQKSEDHPTRFDRDADADDDGTSRQEVESAFKRVMLSPVWTSGQHTQPERAGTDFE